MIDKGDKYEIHLEVPGIENEKVNVKATKNSLQITGEQSEKA
jgi:HSP20 family protein